ncbi:MAG TPA: T9SS type A sorting domain-containing protein, partial [Bacteroidia bacterium]|nr:T9SS type A sorting domain-containing protein [Bacteroidia bacterium]HRH08847.1 T9SS type A sorting domain-containing protein [Bacteroidia bacterium]
FIHNGYTFLCQPISGRGKLSKIKAAGNSSALLRYTSSDYYPYETITYYRLKQVDYDGKYSYSKIISLLGNDLNFALVKHYPNPAKDEVFFYFLLDENKSLQLEVTDMYGKLVKSETLEMSEPEEYFQLSLHNFAPGMYCVRFFDKEGSQQQIIKICKE